MPLHGAGRAAGGGSGRAGRPRLAAGHGHGGGRAIAAAVDVAAPHLDPADQDAVGHLAAGLGEPSALERVGAQPAWRRRALSSTQGASGS